VEGLSVIVGPTSGTDPLAAANATTYHVKYHITNYHKTQTGRTNRPRLYIDILRHNYSRFLSLCLWRSHRSRRSIHILGPGGADNGHDPGDHVHPFSPSLVPGLSANKFPPHTIRYHPIGSWAHADK
jgi:hypothetical protein